jgi:hypothetical protein
MDSHGERSGPYPCQDYDILDKVQRGKGNVNLQIETWVDGVIDSTTHPEEVLEWIKDYPEWVTTSFIRQLHKKAVKVIGFVPTFMNLPSSLESMQ